jgi:DNA primase
MDTDLLALIGQDVALRRQAATHGGEYAGACPFCGGQDKRTADRFRVWPAEGRYWCRRCGRHGDAIQYLRDRHGLSYREARQKMGPLRIGHIRPTTGAVDPQSAIRNPQSPMPSAAWQAAASRFCEQCIDHLWAPDGARARAWLREARGLDERTTQQARLGYNPEDAYQERETWGLPPDPDARGRPRRVWLPRGIVIPWLVGGRLWRVNIRRPLSAAQQARGEPKYMGPAGSAVALYNADGLCPARPAVLVEGELDALTVQQYAGDLAAAVATGSTMGARRVRWVAKLAACPAVLVAFDADPAGEEAASYWLKLLPRAHRWRPYYGKDANGLALAGGDVHAWVEAGVGNVAVI